MNITSRYASGHIAQEVGRDGGIIDVVSREAEQPSGYFLYQWKDGDRIDIVAQGFGIGRMNWWLILDANPDLRSPTHIRPGQFLRIPKDG